MKRIFLLSATLYLLPYSTQANNSNIEFTLGSWSHHINAKAEYNQQHNTLGIQYKNIEAMTFKNSYSIQSYSLGYSWQTELIEKWVYAGIGGGAVYGYGDIQGYNTITPYISPFVSAYYKQVGFSVGYVPPIGQDTNGILVFSTKLKI